MSIIAENQITLEVVSDGQGGVPGNTWKPTVDTAGNISWQINSGTTPPAQQNIKGPQGDTKYTWVMYADNAQGGGISDNPSGKTYIGIASDQNTPTESTDPTKYKWSLIKGGDGKGISSIDIRYARTTTNVAPESKSITATTPPALENEYKYLWKKETVNYTVGSPTVSITLLAALGGAIKTSVPREGKDEDWWATYGVYGHVENWSDTSSIRNGCGIGDLFTVVGTSTVGKAHTYTYVCDNASGDLHGMCIAHVTANKGDPGYTPRKGVDYFDGAPGADGHMLHATCSTAAATAAKVATLSSGTLTLTPGATVTVTFSNGQSANAPTLNIANTGALPIYTNGSNSAYFASGTTATFTYDVVSGQGRWYTSSEPVYASTVAVGNVGSKNVFINGEGVAVRNGTTVLSEFGADGTVVYVGGIPIAIFGSDGANLISGDSSSIITSDGMSIRNGTNEYFRVKKPVTGSTTVVEVFAGPFSANVSVTLQLSRSYSSAPTVGYPSGRGQWTTVSSTYNSSNNTVTFTPGSTLNSVRVKGNAPGDSSILIVGGQKLISFVTEEAPSGSWHYRKWSNGRVEAWASVSVTINTNTAMDISHMYRGSLSITIPSNIFTSTPKVILSQGGDGQTMISVTGKATSATNISGYAFRSTSGSTAWTVGVYAWTD